MDIAAFRSHAPRAVPIAILAASAGALDLVLLGPRRYAGGDAKADWLGDGRARATLSDIRRMLALFAVACFLAAALVALIALLIQAR